MATMLPQELPDRLERGPVTFHLKAQLAAAGDSTKDPTKPWPDDRKVVELGVFPKRTSESIPTAAPTSDKPRSEPRLVVEVQKAFANEPLSLAVSVDSPTGHESLMLAGLALGTRLSAGVPVSEASWQLGRRFFKRLPPWVFDGKTHCGLSYVLQRL
jgi:hypothetical protein